MRARGIDENKTGYYITLGSNLIINQIKVVLHALLFNYYHCGI